MQIHLLNILATWRLTELLVEERGFYGIFDKFREYAENGALGEKEFIPDVLRVELVDNRHGFWAEISKMLECRYCTSVTVGIALAIVTRQNVLYGLAYSAGALMFGRLFERIEG